MRILANYGYKNCAESYSVTFEQIGDCPKEQADAAVDELFSLAKRAIERQVHGAGTNGNGHKKNGYGLKFAFKNPDAPCTSRQKQMIVFLCIERNKFIGGLDHMTMKEASDIIVELLSAEAEA